MSTTVTLLWAMSENSVIGNEGTLPWHMPDDLRRFKQLTLGNAVVMGRKTWESLPIQPLPNRKNIVVSRNPHYTAEGAEVADSLEEAIESATGYAEVYVIGGASLFEAALQVADRIELTLIHTHLEGDTTMGDVDWSQWDLIAEERHDADERHAWPFTFQTLQRRR